MADATHARSWTGRIAVAVAILAVLLLIAAGPGVRADIWSFRTGFSIMRMAAWAGIAAAVIGAAAIALGRGEARAIVMGLAAIVLGLTAAAVPWSWQRAARTVPPIHDITTDTQNPPEYVAVLPLRANASNPR